MTEWIKATIKDSSYLGIVFLMLLENVFPPIPSELIMPLAGYVSSEGQLSFIGVVLAGTAGAVLGAIVLYFLGRWAGERRLQRWIERRGRWIGVARDDLEKSRNWFEKHGAVTVLACRFIPGVRSLISIPAGISRMNFWLFLVYSTIGSAGWTAALTGAGFWLRQRYSEVDRYIGPVSTVVVAGILLSLVIRGFRLRRPA